MSSKFNHACKFLAAFFILCFVFPASLTLGQVNVKGYYRKDGTYVRPHTRSAPSRSSSAPSTYSSPRQTYIPPQQTYRPLPQNKKTPSSRLLNKKSDSQSSEKISSFKFHQVRTWTAANGKSKIKGRYVGEIEDRFVFLVDDKLKSASKTSLSKDDIDFINLRPEEQYQSREMRTWTFTDGSTIEATFVGVINPYVVLKDAEGKLSRHVKTKLIEKDINYIDNIPNQKREAH